MYENDGDEGLEVEEAMEALPEPQMMGLDAPGGKQ